MKNTVLPGWAQLCSLRNTFFSGYLVYAAERLTLIVRELVILQSYVMIRGLTLANFISIPSTNSSESLYQVGFTISTSSDVLLDVFITTVFYIIDTRNGNFC